ncbi:MAG TPA: hypothetical protein VHG35_12570 [Gemmatimonadales bacterium]|nr:hypothetical protein [Gemmatimonadales bacterium]
MNFREPYLVYPRKFLPETWEVLEEAGFAARSTQDGGRETVAAMALSMMVILADCMAGRECVTVTDRQAAYGALSGFLAAEAGIPPASTLEGMRPGLQRPVSHHPPVERLALISLRLIDVDVLDLRALIALRQREFDGDRSLRTMRHRYVESLKSYVERIQAAENLNDIQEVERQYLDDMMESMRQLKEEVRTGNVQMVTSREFVAGVSLAAAVATALTNPATALSAIGGIPVLLGLINLRSRRQERQRQALLRQPMSWLYRAQQEASRRR